MPVELVCATCGQSFSVPPSEARNGRKYCSRACAPYRSGPRVARVSLNCETCGKAFEILPGQTRRKRRYCCRACYPYPGQLKHGGALKGNHAPEYGIWTDIKSRCLNPNVPAYPRYGGRGIGISPLWVNDFARFLADVGARPSPAHTLDRIANERGYEPGNVAWRSWTEQQNNRRDNVRLTFQGRTQTRSEWARELGINYGTLRSRLNTLGWSVEQALTTPPRSRPRRPD